MVVVATEVMPVREEDDVVRTRQLVRRRSAELGFSLVEQTKLVTAASEIARNAVIYGGGGSMDLTVLRDGPKVGLKLTFADQGPGIPDIDLALRDGFTSGGGLGLGLGGARRLVNDFSIDSRPGEGTRVTLVRWKQR
jgi:serine/threonine-protein kinase RsbT